jgi:lysozyme
MRIIITCSLLLFPGLGFAADFANSVLSLSHYDCQSLDFNLLRRGGVEGVIHEATFPANDSDGKYFTRQNEAANAGILWGAYHYGNGSDPARQADHFLDVVRSDWRQGGGRLDGVLLVLDAEKNSHYPGGSMEVHQAVEFLRRVHQITGVYPGLYSGEYWLQRVFDSPSVDASSREILAKSWLWIANYHKPPKATAPWPNWTLWQYTGDGVCGLPHSTFPTGVANLHRIERTVFSGSNTALRGFWKEHSWRPGGGVESSAAQPVRLTSVGTSG